MSEHKARRRILAVLATIGAGAIGVLWRRSRRPAERPPWGPAPSPEGGTPEPRPDGANVHITLVRDGDSYRGATAVQLTRDGDVTTLERAGDGTFHGRVEPGTYRVTARTPGPLRLPPSDVVVRSEPAAWELALVAPDEPYLRIGGEVLPFRARTDLFVVAVPGPTDTDRAARLVESARQGLGLELVDPDTLEPTDRARSGGLLVLRDASGRGWTDRERAAELRRAAAASDFDERELRIGFIVDAGDRGRAMLDRRYLVQLGGDQPAELPGKVPERVIELFGRLEADVLRALPEPHTYLVEFRDHDFARHLRTLESYVAEGVFRYAEPDLVTSFTDLVDLGLYLAQYQGAPQPASVPLQSVRAPEAWAALVAAGTAGATSSFATVDRGVVAGSPFLTGVDHELRDWQGNVVGGHVGPPPPPPLHGMEVFGVASGNGHLGVWGVAPNLRHVAVQRSDAAGTAAFWDPFDELLAAGVRVVSLSFKPNFTGWDSYSEARLNTLVDAGMLVVVAAGNDRSRLRNVDGSHSTRGDATSNGVTVKWVSFPLAAHPRTLTVSGTQQSAGAVQYWDMGGGTGTNRGDAVDICAPATGYLTCVDGTSAGASQGTSLSAPVVAATAAAVRALRPAASVAQVKTVLCDTAEQIRPEETTFWAPVAAPADWDPTVPVPPHHLRYGFGQLDVAAALARAVTLP